MDQHSSSSGDLPDLSGSVHPSSSGSQQPPNPAAFNRPEPSGNHPHFTAANHPEPSGAHMNPSGNLPNPSGAYMNPPDNQLDPSAATHPTNSVARVGKWVEGTSEFNQLMAQRAMEERMRASASSSTKQPEHSGCDDRNPSSGSGDGPSPSSGHQSKPAKGDQAKPSTSYYDA